jgi:hypothetical protein
MCKTKNRPDEYPGDFWYTVKMKTKIKTKILANKRLVASVAGAVLVVGLLFYFRHDIPLFDFLFKTQRDASGEVSISVIPDFTTGVDMKISMSTKGGELVHDMMRAAVFEDEDGTVHLPTAWEGDPAGGKKREGVLHFGTFAPMPKKVDLTILNIGTTAQRKFSWMVPQK